MEYDRELDMSDVAALIAPRPLVLVIGTSDPINPLEWTRRAFEEVRRIYRAAGAEDCCRLVVGAEGHRFYAAEAWPVFEEVCRVSSGDRLCDFPLRNVVQTPIRPRLR